MSNGASLFLIYPHFRVINGDSIKLDRSITDGKSKMGINQSLFLRMFVEVGGLIGTRDAEIFTIIDLLARLPRSHLYSSNYWRWSF